MRVPSSGERAFLIGAMRAGTTSLYNYLAAHPDIFPSRRKEPRFFCSPVASPRERAEYEALYAGRAGERWTFEASTHYARFPKHVGVPQRIHAVFPNARFIYVLRHPVDRICSAYLHWLAHGFERRDFETAVLSEPSEYLDVSRYAIQLTQYWDLFPRDQVMVLFFEDFIRDIPGTVRRVCEFLEIDATFAPPNVTRRFNESARERAPSSFLHLMRSATMQQQLPWRLRHWTKSVFRKPLPKKQDLLTRSVHNRIVGRLEEDVARLKELLGGSGPAWDLSYR